MTPKPTTRPPAVLENGQPVAVVSAPRTSGSAANVALLIDRSQSMSGEVARERDRGRARVHLTPSRPGTRSRSSSSGTTAVQLTGFSTGTTDADAALRDLVVDGAFRDSALRRHLAGGRPPGRAAGGAAHPAAHRREGRVEQGDAGRRCARRPPGAHRRLLGRNPQQAVLAGCSPVDLARHRRRYRGRSTGGPRQAVPRHRDRSSHGPG